MKPRPVFHFPEMYDIKEVLPHAEMMEFVKRQMKLPGLFRYLFWLFVLFSTLSIAYRMFEGPGIQWNYLFGLVWGLPVFALLIPLHECLHVLGYRLAGAKKASIHAHWRKGMFYALAPGFVCEYAAFVRMALLPFVVITALLFVLMVYLPGLWEPVLLGALWIHTGACYGDFALLNWMHRNRKQTPVTWDDHSESISYFALKKTLNA